MAIVLTLWNLKAGFPVQFLKLQGFNEDTELYIAELNKMTPLIHDMFNHIHT
jgi:hypothetical protein